MKAIESQQQDQKKVFVGAFPAQSRSYIWCGKGVKVFLCHQLSTPSQKNLVFHRLPCMGALVTSD